MSAPTLSFTNAKESPAAPSRFSVTPYAQYIHDEVRFFVPYCSHMYLLDIAVSYRIAAAFVVGISVTVFCF